MFFVCIFFVLSTFCVYLFIFGKCVYLFIYLLAHQIVFLRIAVARGRTMVLSTKFNVNHQLTIIVCILNVHNANSKKLVYNGKKTGIEFEGFQNRISLVSLRRSKYNTFES
jgi:hypothetical protein